MCLFGYGLFGVALRLGGHKEMNGTAIDESWIGKCVEGNGCVQIDTLSRRLLRDI